MNTIVILLDSLNFHCLEPYGAAQVQTPNLRRFAERACVFDNHFVGSLPCMPARRELLTGRQEFLWRGWGHIEPWDRHLANDAAQAGAVTQMITDHYHYWEAGAHQYFEPFQGIDFIRGHELDMWQTDPLGETPAWVRSIDAYRHEPWGKGQYPGWGSRYYANARQWREESAFPCAQVMQRSAEWLQRNRAHDTFFLWVEAFDPHEPHFLPEPYRSMYVQGTPRPDFNCWPPYQNEQIARDFVAQASKEELAWIRAQYYGKVTMVDHWLGCLFARLDALNLWQDTAVILTTDHGHDLCYNRLDGPTQWGKDFPHPESHARIPLLVWHPRYPGAGRRINALTCAVDVNATVRELVGADHVDGPHGRTLLPLLRGETEHHRDYALYGIHGAGATISTAGWTLAQGANGAPWPWYSTTGQRVSPEMTSGKFIPGVEIPQWRVPGLSTTRPSNLWERAPFTLASENVLNRFPEQTREMRALLHDAIEVVTGPPEVYEALGF